MLFLDLKLMRYRKEILKFYGRFQNTVLVVIVVIGGISSVWTFGDMLFLVVIIIINGRDQEFKL